ncbi:MAG: aminomethyl-transferring glycine dehydrogenase [Flavobacteriales bacterium]|nr:aminomethyl-transferring glycine dehydrogenase [Flavobacteriales bacterium]
MNQDTFVNRHIGPREEDLQEMLATIGVASLEELISKTVPASIRMNRELDLPEAMTEVEYAEHIKAIGAKNKLFKTYIGLGYYDTVVPNVIKRNILENPGWYTAYTPYQAEIAQGRLEALLNFQTMVCDLTGLELANASLLDEATAAAEAMIMLYNSRSREATKKGVSKFFVSADCFPQTIDLLHTRSAPLGIELIIGDYNDVHLSDEFFGALLQYPAVNGEVNDLSKFVEKAHGVGAAVAVAADLMSLVLLKSPGSWGADVVVGNTQRFGVPLGYGGPHAAYFATREEFKRNIPGRIIGVSVDSQGNPALRMALQTREQHIKRDKATSNICTAQALLAIMASMYAVYHGPKGLKNIATNIHQKTAVLASKLKSIGYEVKSNNYFDTIQVVPPSGVNVTEIKELAEAEQINFRYIDNRSLGISLDETTNLGQLQKILEVFSSIAKTEPVYVKREELSANTTSIAASFLRADNFLTHPTFNSYHSETEMMRYIKRLENKDISLVHSMISLGSCTMKLNAASELYPISMAEFANIHPFVPLYQTKGYQIVFNELEKSLCEITGFEAVSFQPNSGAQGEYAGLMVIDQYHKSRGDAHRNVALIPSSAHGTNPASAVMAGMKVVVTKCDESGNIDVEDLRARAEEYAETLSCLMVTYPSTHGVFEESIQEVTKIIHDNGGQVYMDGANMNAQVGLTNPGLIGADVCHLNLHKTFAIPHGGGGPGMGPIGVAKHLAPFLPGHSVVPMGGSQPISAVSAAPWGSSLILLISYGYIKMLGASGVKKSTQYAILNANYLKTKLAGTYTILYSGKHNTVAHEMILDCRDFKKNSGVEAGDIAKRLMDYGYHAPTVSFPVAGTLMVEPTESESKAELDKFISAMISIRKEISEVENGVADLTDNVLHNAPHTAKMVVNDAWSHAYSREKAAFPLSWVSEAKVWPSVGRVDNAQGDRNLICTCPSVEEYASEASIA